MGDVIFVLATIAFFAICALYVSWCDRIIGADDFGTATDPGSESDGNADPLTNPVSKEIAA